MKEDGESDIRFERFSFNITKNSSKTNFKHSFNIICSVYSYFITPPKKNVIKRVPMLEKWFFHSAIKKPKLTFPNLHYTVALHLEKPKLGVTMVTVH